MRYIYKKRWGGIHETEDFKEVGGLEYRISLDKAEYENMQDKLHELELLKKNLKEKNTIIKENNLKNKALTDRISELEQLNEADTIEIDKWRNEIDILQKELKSLKNTSLEEIRLNNLKIIFEKWILKLKEEKNFVAVREKIDNISLILESTKSDENDYLNGLFEIIITLKQVGMKCNNARLNETKKLNELEMDMKIEMHLLEREIEELKDSKADLERESECLKYELERISDSNEFELKLEKAYFKNLNLNEIIDRKQKVIRKLKSELEYVRNKKNKTKSHDITLNSDSDSVYEDYREKILNKPQYINTYVERRYLSLNLERTTKLEDVIEYLKEENLEKNCIELFNLIKEKNVVLWKVHLKNDKWQVILLKK